MKLRKINAAFLLFVFLISNSVLGASAIVDKNTKNAEINKSDYINLGFWENWNDANLKYYIMRATEGNYDLKIASLNSEIYRNYITSTRASEFPSVGTGVMPGYLKMPETKHYDWNVMLPVYVNYEADIFLKNHDKTKASKKDYEMALLDEKSSYISVVSMVASVYFNILRVENAIKLQNEIVLLRGQIYDLMTLSYNEGITSLQDVIRANKAYIQGNSELINLKKQREQLVNNLAVLVGENPNNAGEFKYSNLEEVAYGAKIPTEISSEIIVNRPDYQKSEKNVEKAGINVRVAKKEFLPAINITGLSLFSSDSFSSFFATKNALIGVGGAALADLFTGGRKVANLKIRKTDYKKALSMYEKTNLIAIQEVNDALVAIKHDETKYNETKKQNNLEIKDFDLKNKKYKEGVISYLELIQAKENLLVVKKLLMSDKADCFIDYISLYKAVGANI